MIPDERLSVLISGIDLENISPHDIIDMATELQTSRQTIKRLMEDGEQLALLLSAELSLNHKICLPKCIEHHGIDQHEALLKELEEKK